MKRESKSEDDEKRERNKKKVMAEKEERKKKGEEWRDRETRRERERRVRRDNFVEKNTPTQSDRDRERQGESGQATTLLIPFLFSISSNFIQSNPWCHIYHTHTHRILLLSFVCCLLLFY